MHLSIEIQIWISGLAFLLGVGFILPLVRRDYLNRGRLSQPFAFLQLVVWFLFHAFLGLVVWGDLWPSATDYIPKNWFGGPFVLLGLGLCLAGMGAFRSITRITGREANSLIISGIYRWTRNPQYSGYGLVILGVVLGYWCATAWLALPAYGLLVYVTVRIEEEHLTKVFGEQYRAYCREVPRFVGLHRTRKAGN